MRGGPSRSPYPGEAHVTGNGLTHGTIAGMIFNDLLQKRSNPWAKLYDPARKPTSFQGLKAAGRKPTQSCSWERHVSVEIVVHVSKTSGS